MSYTSLTYFVFVIVLIALYYVFPRRFRWLVLLGGSMFFYGRIISDIRQFVIFLATIVISYIFGLLLQRMREKEGPKKAVLAAGIILSTLPLLVEKIGGFAGEVFMGTGRFSWLFSIGLAFYSLQIIAYLVDVYKGKIDAQGNILKYALFISFFPQIIQGPIPRYQQLGSQLFDGNDYDFDRIISGIQLVIWGFFLKFMIADKAAVVVDTVFDNYRAYSGLFILVAAVLYSLQLYADFLACTTLSQGVSSMFGISIIDNFDHPYFSSSIKEFWRRWHISLSSWLRDYIYIPLGGNRKGKLRKWLNIFITFGISGIWHGSGFKYLVWGLVHAFYQIMGEVLPFGKKEDTALSKVIKQIVTFILVMLAWIIFRAESLRAAAEMIGTMLILPNPWILFDDSLFGLGLGWKEFVVLISSILVMFTVSLLQEKNVKIREVISRQNIVVRWAVYLLAIWVIWIFGTYGFGFDAKDFIYGGF